jgi:hypothetical protein
LRRLTSLRTKDGPMVWRENLGLRGLIGLPVSFDPKPNPSLA